jgi:hypothetical protein
VTLPCEKSGGWEAQCNGAAMVPVRYVGVLGLAVYLERDGQDR